jgi:NADPH:quinone reductase-like Zn-dependent oxidoreductase
MPTSKVIRFYEEGGPDELRIDTVDVPEPGPDEVRVRVAAIGLNRAELHYRTGNYYHRPARFPAILGYEAAGTVDALGPGVEGLAVGDAVSVVPSFSMTEYGVYAERPIVPVRSIVRRPQGQTAEAGAALWMAGLTAYGGLIEAGGLRAGDTVLITAATGSIGIAAIQVANRIGAHVIATTRDEKKRERLLAAGAEHVIVTREENLVERVRSITGGRGAELVFDAVAGPGVVDLATVTAKDGKLVLYGFLDQKAEAGAFGKTVTPLPLTNWSSSMRWFAALEMTPDTRRRATQFVLSGMKSGALSPVLDRVFPFEEMASAHRYMEQGGQFGKVLVRVAS